MPDVRKNDNSVGTQAKKAMGRRKPRFVKGKGLSYRQRLEVARTVEKKINRVMERKHHDLDNILTTPIAGTPVIDWLTNITRGDLPSQRNGEVITPEYLTFRAKLTGALAGSGTNQAYRLLIVQWNDNETENPIQIGDVIESSTFVFGNYHTGEAGSFRVIYDEMGTVAKEAANPDHTRFIKLNIDLKKYKKINWSVDSETHGHLYLITWSDEVTNGPAFRWGTRLGYLDG